MRSRLHLLLLGAPTVGLVLLSLVGCPTHPRSPEAPSATPVGAAPAGPGSQQAPRHEGRPYDVQSRESLLMILAFRGGALSKAGHNHVIASHDINGTFYVPEDLTRTTFELHIPVAQLTIDETELRTQEGPDFPAEVPESAKEGTRRNMLSEALLNGAQYPEITLVSQRVDTTSTGSEARADVQVSIRGQTHTISVPVRYSLANDELTASGDVAIKQTDLGLAPFSAMLGALQVQDELRVKFRISARRAQVKGAGH
jgi:polyisoprenoid-binding protein YceI